MGIKDVIIAQMHINTTLQELTLSAVVTHLEREIINLKLRGL